MVLAYQPGRCEVVRVNEPGICRSFLYPEDKTPSQLADEISDWIKGWND